MKIKNIGTVIIGIGIVLAIGIVGRDDCLMEMGKAMPYGLLVIGCVVSLVMIGLGAVVMVKGWNR